MRSRILYKILLWVIPITTGSLLLSLLISRHFMARILQTYIPELNIQVAGNAAQEVTHYLNVAELLLNNTSDAVSNESSQIAMSRHLMNLHMNEPLFSDLFVIEKHGMEIANIDVEGALKKRDVTTFRQSALQGRTGYSGIHLKDQRIPYMEICVPVEQWREITGALCGEIDFMSVWNFLDAKRIGTTGFTMLVTREGKIIAHPDKKKVLMRAHLSRAELQRLGARRRTYNAERDGVEKLVAFDTVGKTGWKAVVEQNRAEVFQNYQSMIRYVIVLIAGIIGVSFILLTVFSFQITKPIRQLTDAAKIYASGTLDHEIGIRSTDEIGELAAAFNKMIKDLNQSRKILIQQEKLSSIGKFASSIGHELKGPITALGGYPYLLNEHPSEQELAEYSAEIKAELERIDRILERLMKLSRQGDIVFEQVDLNAALRSVAKTLDHHFMRMKSTSIRLELHEELPPVKADRNLLQQVFVNLLLNACDAIESQGRVAIRTIVENGTAAVQIADNGSGIRDEVRDKIFEPFFTTKKTASNTGLGLYITKELLDLCGARIEAASNNEKGTVFTIFFNS